MDIKCRNIYHCSTERAIREFLSNCKKQGFTYKNDKEINIGDASEIYNVFEANTCFKTNTGKISFGARQGYLEKEPDREIIEFVATPHFDKIYAIQTAREFGLAVYQLFEYGYSAKIQNIPLTVFDVINTYNLSKFTDGSERVIVLDEQQKRIMVSTKKRMSELGYTKIDTLDLKVPQLPQKGDIIKLKSNGELMVVSSISDCGITIYAKDQRGSNRSITLKEYDVVTDDDKTDCFKAVKVGDVICYKDSLFKVTGKYENYISISIVVDNNYLDIVGIGNSYVLFCNAQFRICDTLTDNDKYVVGSFWMVNGEVHKIVESNNLYVKTITSDGCAYTYTIVCFEEHAPKMLDIKEFNPAPDAMVMPEDMLGALCDKAVTVFREHRYLDANQVGVMAWLKKWNKEKGWLASLLRMNPDWDDDNLCVTGIFEEKRETSEAKRWDKLCEFSTQIYNGCGAPNTLYDILRTTYACDCCYSKSVSQSLKDYAERADSRIRISVGAKLTRAIRQMCSVYGVTNHPDFDKYFAPLSDAFSDGKIKRRYCLSINPLDFLLMSNGNSWSSCHCLENGNSAKCYQAGTMSYPVDKVSMIFYTVEKTDVQDDLWSLPKLHRQLFMYSGEYLMQSRLYPTWQDTDYCSLTKATVKNIIEVCENTKDKGQVWGTDLFNIRGGSKNYFATATKSSHYPDYIYEYNITIVPKANAKIYGYGEPPTPFSLPQIGGMTICPKCGKEHRDDTHNCYCNSCKH